MRALTVLPGQPDSIDLTEIPMPSPADGALLVRALALGLCGTDREIIAGEYGVAPPGETRLVLGHESLGEIVEAPPGSSFTAGDFVVGIVRRPDPLPCPACAAGQWDMCLNDGYTERGIKARNGYGSEWFRLEPDFAVKVECALGELGVLLEPASVLAKAWDHVDRIAHRAPFWKPRTVLVTGAGPIGLLAALMGAQRQLDVHVLDRARDGLKPDLVRDLGATYHAGDPGSFKADIAIECTGAVPVIADAMTRLAPAGILCLAGVTPAGRRIEFDIGTFNRTMVLDNDVVFGSVNANRTHYESAARSLAAADRHWLSRLITRRLPLSRWREAFEHRDDDIKVVIDFVS
ncbi:MAG: glucose 1-dehydrogenase [Pseudolabrys sp.]|nr:glucose 1-dehydrogenase [Pseudolabrys sp.]